MSKIKPENVYKMIMVLNAIDRNNDKEAHRLLLELRPDFNTHREYQAFIFRFGRFTDSTGIGPKSSDTKDKEIKIRDKWIDYAESEEIQRLMKGD